jgi:Protein of unknown function (DUF2905)
MTSLGKSLMMLGLLIVVLGAAIAWIPRVGLLPGDFYIHRGNLTFYFPLATCVLLSVLATIVFSLMARR